MLLPETGHLAGCFFLIWSVMLVCVLLLGVLVCLSSSVWMSSLEASEWIGCGWISGRGSASLNFCIWLVWLITEGG
ncbi:hypothetical protein Nepgr_028921 [Nepenthes gracilis]|uniref:Uncharacterized protein n=1 Tax=Nepenthes gracilis TaxID=150966 RepID=A0AAD3TBL5_NEPGR|nr:hypothetical protein Nepgr_028921 [Nepenthes gracilis]